MVSSVTACLSESVQKRALKIIFPVAETYSESFQLAALTTLADRRSIWIT